MDRPVTPIVVESPICDPATVRAMGQFATLLVTVLHRDRVMDMGDFTDHLSRLACITDETDPAAGSALACWAGMLRDVADDLQERR